MKRMYEYDLVRGLYYREGLRIHRFVHNRQADLLQLGSCGYWGSMTYETWRQLWHYIFPSSRYLLAQRRWWRYASRSQAVKACPAKWRA